PEFCTLSLHDALPISGYAALHAGAMGDGALPGKVKELIALAIAVTRECDGCVTAHARAAVRQGVTAAEVAEAMGVAILMNGGPGTVWGPRAYAAFEEVAASLGPPPWPGRPGGPGGGRAGRPTGAWPRGSGPAAPALRPPTTSSPSRSPA